MNKVKLVPAYNCKFNLKKGGLLTFFATPEFNVADMIKTYRMAKLHAKWKKIKKPTKYRFEMVEAA